MIIPSATADGQNSAYRHLNMKGAFGNGGALRFFKSGIGCWPMILFVEFHRLEADRHNPAELAETLA